MTIRVAPRDYSLEPDGFGRASNLQWRAADTAAGERKLRAAQMQHQLSLTIAVKLRTLGQTRRQYADSVEMSYDRVTKVLRGDSAMHLEDIAAAGEALFPDEPQWIANANLPMIDLSDLTVILEPLDSRKTHVRGSEADQPIRHKLSQQ